MVIAKQHSRVAVARYLGQFVHGVDACKSAGAFVAKIVKAQVRKVSSVWLTVVFDAQSFIVFPGFVASPDKGLGYSIRR